ncbi:MAG: HlyD family secretion protein [Nevskia sp.]|nr:HlyD family secretion protein [Nevskia sp.]
MLNRTALASGLALLLCCVAVSAHESSAPEVLLDKAAQHRAGIRTQRAGGAAEVVRLPGLVIADPRRELRVAAPQDGVVEAAGTSLPLAGQQVRAGQVLAYLRPVLSQPDRRDMDVDLTAAQRDMKLDRIQIDRYGINENQRLEIKLPTPSVEILTNYRTAQARSGELQGALQQPLPLLAPRSGTILRSPAAVGRVVTAGQSLFELNAPGALAVEAEYADDDIDADAVRQATMADGQAVSLEFIGVSYDSGLRTHRALYAVVDTDADVHVNQPLSLAAPREHDGIALPAAAVFRRDGHAWVWVHPEAQRFIAQQVEVAAVDGDEQLHIRSGLHGGERVVTDGVAALNAAVAVAGAVRP